MAVSATGSGVDNPHGNAVDHNLFRGVMGSFVTGVTVITSQLRGEIRGMTANAFMSGSLEPPLCLVSISTRARMHAMLLETGHFGVSILAHGQESLINHFAGRPVEGLAPKYEFADNTPLLAHAHAMLVARIVARHPCGDHSLFVGHVTALRHTEGRAPLVLYRGRLATLTHPHQQSPGPMLDFW